MFAPELEGAVDPPDVLRDFERVRPEPATPLHPAGTCDCAVSRVRGGTGRGRTLSSHLVWTLTPHDLQVRPLPQRVESQAAQGTGVTKEEDLKACSVSVVAVPPGVCMRSVGVREIKTGTDLGGWP